MDDEAYFEAVVADLRARGAALPPDSPERLRTDADLVEALLLLAGVRQEAEAAQHELDEARGLLDALRSRARPGGRMHRGLCLLAARLAFDALEATGEPQSADLVIAEAEQALVGPAADGESWWWEDGDEDSARALLAVALWLRRWLMDDDDARQDPYRDRVIDLLTPVVEPADGLRAVVEGIETLTAVLGLARADRSRCPDHANPDRLADRQVAILHLRTAHGSGELAPFYQDEVAFQLALLRYLDEDQDRRALLALLEPLTGLPDAEAARALDLGGDIATALHDERPGPDTLDLALLWHSRRTAHPDSPRADRSQNRLFHALYLIERGDLPDRERRPEDPPPQADRADAVAQLEQGLVELVWLPPADADEMRLMLLSCELTVLRLDLPNDLPDDGLDLLIERGREYLDPVDPDDEDRPVHMVMAGMAHFVRTSRRIMPYLYTQISHVMATGSADPSLSLVRLEPRVAEDIAQGLALLQAGLGLHHYEDELYLSAANALGALYAFDYVVRLPEERRDLLRESLRWTRTVREGSTPDSELRTGDSAAVLILALCYSIWSSAPFRTAHRDPNDLRVPDVSGHPSVVEDLHLVSALLEAEQTENPDDPGFALIGAQVLFLLKRGEPDLADCRVWQPRLRRAASGVDPHGPERSLRAMLLVSSAAMGLQLTRGGAATAAETSDALDALRETCGLLDPGSPIRTMAEELLGSGPRQGLLGGLLGLLSLGEQFTPYAAVREQRTAPPAPLAAPPQPEPREPELDQAAAVLLGDGSSDPFALPIGRLHEIVTPEAAAASPVAAVVLALARHNRWLRERDSPDLAAAIRSTGRAVEQLRSSPPGSVPALLADRCALLLAGQLLDRHLLLGDHADLEAAHTIQRRLLARLSADAEHPDLVTLLIRAGEADGLPAAARLFRPVGSVPAAYPAELRAATARTGLLLARTRPNDPVSGEGARIAVALLIAAATELPADHPGLPAVRSELGLHRLEQALLADAPAEARAATDDLLAAAGDCPQESPHRSALLLRAAFALCSEDPHGSAPVPERVARLDRGIALLEAAAVAPGQAFHGARARCLYGVGGLRLARHRHSGEPADLARAVAALEDARSALNPSPGDPFAAVLMRALARACRAHGPADAEPRRRSRETARSLLIAHARAVLLQTGTGQGLRAAQAAGADMLRLANWCIADDCPEEAVQAVELGRGLVLNAATVGGSVPEMLRDAGRPDLAAEWAGADTADDAGGDGGVGDGGVASPSVPGDLRRRALEALSGEQAEARLLAVPTSARIGRALRELRRDALVQLIPAESGPGHALLVTATGAVRTVPLPGLTVSAHGPLGEYRRTLDRFVATPHPGKAPRIGAGQFERNLYRNQVVHYRQVEQAWQEALEALCDWAGRVAMADLLDRAEAWWPGRTVRLVLMPVDALGMVPWHAARLPGAGRACERAVLSYCAAARQLVDVAERPRLPVDRSQLLLVDPGATPAMLAEAELIHSLYPAATVLGGNGWAPITRETLEPLLPGRGPTAPALTHITCHAVSSASSADSVLHLVPDENPYRAYRLTVAELLAGARDRDPLTPGGLVVLANCTSDLSLGDHDEAVTLSTAFLAAGATSVVGSRWMIADDSRTGLLMCMFHHFLSGRSRDRAAAGSPGDALRAAQLWMLDPDRVVPPELAELAVAAAGRGRARLDELEVWSAFSHHGC